MSRFLLACTSAVGLGAFALPCLAEPIARTIGLVLTDWYMALPEEQGQKGRRKSGFWRDFHNRSIRADATNRMLIEITGIDNESDDPDVVVRTYKGKSKLVEDAAGNVIPWQSQAIDDERTTVFTAQAH